jgi:hypothetical protein
MAGRQRIKIMVLKYFGRHLFGIPRRQCCSMTVDLEDKCSENKEVPVNG